MGRIRPEFTDKSISYVVPVRHGVGVRRVDHNKRAEVVYSKFSRG